MDYSYFIVNAHERLEITPDIAAWAELFYSDFYMDVEPHQNSDSIIGKVTHEFDVWWDAASLNQKAAVVYDVTRCRGDEYQFNDAILTLINERARLAVCQFWGVDETEYPYTTKSDLVKIRDITEDEKKMLLDTTRTMKTKYDTEIENWSRRFNEMQKRFQAVTDIVTDLKAAALSGKSGLITNNAINNISGVPVVSFRDKKTRKQAQKVMKRSVATMEKIIGHENVSLFFAKDGFDITGNKFIFRFTKSKSINLVSNAMSPEKYHSVPYKLSLHSLDGAYLATGCIYIDATPALDQITAVVLNIKSGNEINLVKTTNWFNYDQTFTQILMDMGGKTIDYSRFVELTDAVNIKFEISQRLTDQINEISERYKKEILPEMKMRMLGS